MLPDLTLTSDRSSSTSLPAVSSGLVRRGQSRRPAGVALHRYILPVMAAVAGNGVPASFLDVYRARELAALILAGPLIAVAGAILPASRAARSRTSAALRAE